MRSLLLVCGLVLGVLTGCNDDPAGASPLRSGNKDGDAEKDATSTPRGEATNKDGDRTMTPATPGGTPPKTVFGNGAGFTPVTPIRLVDSRDGTGLGQAAFLGPLEGGVERRIDLRGLDAQLGAVATRVGLALNVAATDTTTDGFVRVYPCGPTPDVATLNFAAGETIAAMAIVAVKDEVCVTSSTSTNVVVDVLGAFEKDRGARFSPAAPQRIFDSRAGAKGTTFSIPVAGLPAGAVGVAAHVTITEPSTGGFARAFACGSEPQTSSINFGPGETIATTVLTSLDAAKTLCITSSADTHVVVDLEASFGGGDSGFVPDGPRRVFDSRAAAGATATTFDITVANLPLGTSAAVLQVTAVAGPEGAVVTAHPCGAASETSSINLGANKVRTSAVFVPVSADGHVCFDASSPVHLIADAFGALTR